MLPAWEKKKQNQLKKNLCVFKVLKTLFLFQNKLFSSVFKLLEILCVRRYTFRLELKHYIYVSLFKCPARLFAKTKLN